MSKQGQRGFGAAAPFLGMGLQLGVVSSSFYLQLFFLSPTVGTLYAFFGPAFAACVAALGALGFGFLPPALCTRRALAVAGLIELVVGMTQIAAMLMAAETNALLQVTAGAFLGLAAACGFAGWIDSAECQGVTAFALGMFLAVLGAVVVLAATSASEWACWVGGLVSGAVSFALCLAAPPIKSVGHMRDFSCVAKWRGTFFRVGISAFALSGVWSYSLCHFFRYPVAMSKEGAFASCAVGIAAVALMMVASKPFSKNHLMSGFPVLKAFPLFMVFSFVPLEYLSAFSPGLQVGCLLASGIALVPLLLCIGHEIARLIGCKPIAIDVFVFGALFAGALVGVAVNLAVGLNASSFAWAVAPSICLIVGIFVCEFLLTRSAVKKEVVEVSNAEGAPEAIRGDDNVRGRCVLLGNEHGLTAREVDVLCLLVRGYSMTRVCELLHIAEGTATTHKRHIYKKLSVHTKNDLIDLMRQTRESL